MLEFGEKLTVMPSAMAADDLGSLRRAGFSERESVAITAAAAYRNFITRVADGLGVELGQSGDGYYDSAVLRAFGVTETAVGGTLYADRERSTSEREPADRSGAKPPRGAPDDGRASWLDSREDVIGPAGPAEFRNLAVALSLKPDTLVATLEFASLVDRGGSGLGARIEAIIGMVVAASAGLSYLGSHHAQHLLETGTAPRDLRRLIDNPAGSELDGGEREVAYFCDKLSRAPGTMARADLERLRAAGFDDPALVTIVAAASFANYCGRLAAGLGVGPEAELSEAARSAI